MKLNIIIQGNQLPQRFIVGLSEGSLIYSARYKYEDDDPNGEEIPHSTIARAHGLDLTPGKTDVLGGGNVTLRDNGILTLDGVSGKYGATPFRALYLLSTYILDDYLEFVPGIKGLDLPSRDGEVKKEVWEVVRKLYL